MYIRLHPGHLLFRLDMETGIIDTIKADKVIISKTLLYCSALNTKNAEKKFNKMVEYLLNKHLKQ